MPDQVRNDEEWKSPSRLRERSIVSPHQLRGDILGGIDADHRRLRREGAHFGDEGGGGGHREMGAHRGDIRPLLAQDEAIGLLDIDMAAMPQTPRPAARPRAMMCAELNQELGDESVRGREWPK